MAECLPNRAVMRVTSSGTNVSSEERRSFETTAIRVLDVLAASPEPLGAYKILERLRQFGRYDPPTVCRVFAKVVHKRSVHRLEKSKAYIVHFVETASVAGRAQEPSALFMICDKCRSVNAIDDLRLGRLIDCCATAASFLPRIGTIEVLGPCAICRNREPGVADGEEGSVRPDQASSGEPT